MVDRLPSVLRGSRDCRILQPCFRVRGSISGVSICEASPSWLDRIDDAPFAALEVRTLSVASTLPPTQSKPLFPARLRNLHPLSTMILTFRVDRFILDILRIDSAEFYAPPETFSHKCTPQQELGKFLSLRKSSINLSVHKQHRFETAV